MKMNGFLQKICLFLLSVSVLSILSSCGFPMKYTRDISNVAPLSALKLKLPGEKGKTAETHYTVAIVEVNYEDAMKQVMQQAMQQGTMAVQMGGNMPGFHYRKMDTAKNVYFDSIKKALKADIDQILLTKNIHVTGPFKDRDAMTFDEKKRAIYTFTPEIQINVDTKAQAESGAGYNEKGEIIVSGALIFMLRESITGEKVWTKRMEVDPIAKPYIFVAKFKSPQMTVADINMIIVSGVKEADNTDEVLASALSEFYSALSDKIWKHIDPEEWEKYLTQAENLRKEKRY